jgi:hypothetical protein
MKLPETSLQRALARTDAIWHPSQSPHVLVFAQSGAGKSTLIRSMLGLCESERVLILDVKGHPDPVWEGPADDPWRYGKPVQRLTPRFCLDEPGGGPRGTWARLVGSPDRAETARRFSDALDIVAAEGSCILVCEDVRILCRQLKLAEQVDEILNTARSANVLAILSATDLSYISGRSQGSQIWCGFSGGSLPAAKAAAELLGWRGREAQDYLASVRRHHFVFSENEEGSAGAVLVTPGAVENLGR